MSYTLSNNHFFKNQLKKFYQSYAQRFNINSEENNYPNYKSRTYKSSSPKIHDVESTQCKPSKKKKL